MTRNELHESKKHDKNDKGMNKAISSLKNDHCRQIDLKRYKHNTVDHVDPSDLSLSLSDSLIIFCW